MDDLTKRVRRAAMTLLARREHTQTELLQKLSKKTYPKSLINTCIEALQNENLQSDQRFCESYLNYRAGAGFGPLRILQEIKSKGLSDELFYQCLEACDQDWHLHCLNALEKRFRHEADFNKAKALRFLTYRGFTPDQIKFTMSEFEKSQAMP